MKRHAHLLALFGAFSQLLIPAGLLRYWMLLDSAMMRIDLSDTRDTKRMMDSIGQVMNSTRTSVDSFVWAFLLAMIGLVPFIYAMTRLQYRRPWAFWFACIYGGLLTFSPPVGTVFGLILLIYALSHRHEFVPAPVPTPTPD